MDTTLQPPPLDLAPLPDWMLAPGARPQDLPALRRQNEITMYENMFERVMEQVECGQAVSTALSDDPRTPGVARFLAWVMKDERRKERYYEAQTIAAEMVSNQMIRIADASDSLEDVQRSTLKINTRKWLMGVWNRKRFGEVKQIDQTVTIDMVGAMEAARERASARRGEIVDVQPREIKP